jgi:hypothetical protein
MSYGYADTVCDLCGGAMIEEEGFPLGDDLVCESCYSEYEPDDDGDVGDHGEDLEDEYAHAGADDDDDDDLIDDDGW